MTSSVVRTSTAAVARVLRRRRWLVGAAATALVLGTWSAPALAAGPVAVCTATWIGGSTGDWSNNANWNTLYVPGSAGHTSDEVCIPSTATVRLDAGSYTVAAINDNGPFATSPGNLVGPSTATNPSLQITGGATALGSALGSFSVDNGTITVQAGVVLTATSFSLGAISNPASSGPAHLSGSGQISVAGDITFAGGETNGGAPLAPLVFTQSAGHTFTVGDGGTWHSFLYGASITTPNDVTFGGTSLFSLTTLTTTGNLVLNPGAQLTQSSTLSAHGVVTSGAGGTIAPAVTLTSTTSSLGGDLSVGGLSVNAGASLTIPAGKTVTDTAGSGQLLGTVTGAGTLDIAGGAITAGSGGVLSVTSLKIGGGGSLTTSAGSVVTLGGVLFTSGAWNASGSATIGAGGLNVTSAAGFPTLAGVGTVTVAGDVTLAGAQTNGGLTLAQTGSHLFSISNGIQSQSYVYSTTITTPNSISESGTTLYATSSVTTTGNLVLAPGTQLTQNSTITAAGVTTTVGTAASVLPSITLTGTSSSLGGDLSVQDLTVATGGRLFVPSPRTVAVAASHKFTVQSGGSLTGDGTVAGDVVNQGTVSPGTTAAGTTVATLTVGSYSQSSTGTVAIQEAAAASNDEVAVTGTTPTSFSGTVAVTSLGGYVPPLGASLTVVSAPNASGAPTITGPPTTTDDLVANHYGPATASGHDIVVVRGAAAPGAPGLTLVPGVASISATVTAPLSDGGAAITNYRLSCSPDCGGTHDSATAGVVALTGLTPGTSYSVSVIAQNSVGDSAATTKAATPNAVVVPLATVTPSTTKLVITTGGTFKAVCRYNVALVKTCAVTAKSATGVVLATGKAVTVPAGATAVSETLTLTAAGITAAKAAGGVAVILTATVTPVAGSALVAKGSLVVVNKSIKVTLLGNVLFGSNSAVLSPAGKAALIKVAKQIQGAKQLECDGHTAKTGNTAGEMKLGLQRATVACAYIKAEIKVLKLKPILKYVVKSYGSTRPVSKTNPALNRRVEFIVSN